MNYVTRYCMLALFQEPEKSKWHLEKILHKPGKNKLTQKTKVASVKWPVHFCKKIFFLDSLWLFAEITYYNHKINMILNLHRINFPQDNTFHKSV